MTEIAASDLTSAPSAVAPDDARTAKAGTALWTVPLVIGLLGSVLMALAAPRLLENPATTWFFHSPVGAHAGATALLYTGLGTLVFAWLGLGHLLSRSPGVGNRVVLGLAATWAVPLFLAPPLFSRDMYSYLAQGAIFRLGHDPYHEAPVVLSRLGAAHVLAAVDPFWRHTTAPYGPLFIAIAGAVAAMVGGNLVGAILVLRLVEVAGIALAAAFVPRLARRNGADERLALWIVVASPLTLLELVAAGHSDALMIGLMVAGLAVALEGRTALGVGLCALASTVKAPAAVAIVFLLVVLARSAGGWPAARRVLLTGVATALAVVAAVSAATGLGIAWISTGDLSTPARVQLAITPASALGWSAAAIAHGLGVGASSHAIADVTSAVLLALTGLLALFLLARTDASHLLPALGAVLCAAALAGPAAWPWYFAWGVTLLACWPGAQRSALLVVALAVASFVVKPGGTLALPIEASPVLLGVYFLLGLAALHHWWPRIRGAT